MRSLPLLAISLGLATSTANANPVSRRQNPHLPTTFAAFGDSYSAGIGSGKFISSSADSADNACARMDGSYPWQLFYNIHPFGSPPGEQFSDFFACSGDILDQIDGQIQKLGTKKIDIATLSISGNDFLFAKVAADCVYPWSLTGINVEGLCTASMNNAQKAINNAANWEKYTAKLNAIKGLLNPGGKIFITGYAKFFAGAGVGDACDNLYFLNAPIVGKALKMKAGIRQRINYLVDQVNRRIKDDIAAPAGDAVAYIDIDTMFEGHRFCEPSNNADPIGSENPEVWFNDIETTLEEKGKYSPASTNAEAAVWEEWTAQIPKDVLDSPDFRDRTYFDKLQKNSVFHPKKDAHFSTAVAIAYQVLKGGQFEGVTLGPNKFCQGLSRGGGESCFDIPVNCGIIEPMTNVIPKILCENGTSF